MVRISQNDIIRNILSKFTNKTCRQSPYQLFKKQKTKSSSDNLTYQHEYLNIYRKRYYIFNIKFQMITTKQNVEISSVEHMTLIITKNTQNEMHHGLAQEGSYSA
jgi:hypothetical protein